MYGRSDVCSASNIYGFVTDTTNCDSLSGSDNIWSIRINGECKNISDTNPKAACKQIKAEDNSSSVLYGRSDSCSNDSIFGFVPDTTDCSEFSTSGAIWSIRVNGVCKNISDTNPFNACMQIIEAKASAVVYGRSDSCSSGSIIGRVEHNTDCDSFSSSASWSIRVNGECKNISDTTAQKACLVAKAELSL